MNPQLAQVLSAIDSANAQDPNTESLQGSAHPKELLYGQRMTEWLKRLNPGAADALQIAARGQHICRWMVPRDSYPKTRPGYLAWRTFLYKFHADKLKELMREAGYGDADCERVRKILSKKDIKKDADSQLVEDTACLVFLEYYLPAFVETQPEEKLIPIIRKTWGKMSEAAHQQALSLKFPDEVLPLIQRALAS